MILCVFLVFKLIANVYCVIAVDTNDNFPQNTTQALMEPYQMEMTRLDYGSTWYYTARGNSTPIQTTVPASGTTTLYGFTGNLPWGDAYNVPWSATVDEQNQ